MVLYQQEDWLREKYITDGWSTTDIARFCGVSFKTISRWLDKYDIQTRDPQSAQLTNSKRIKRENTRRDVRDYMRTRNQAIYESRGEDKSPELKWVKPEGSSSDEKSID